MSVLIILHFLVKEHFSLWEMACLADLPTPAYCMGFQVIYSSRTFTPKILLFQGFDFVPLLSQLSQLLRSLRQQDLLFHALEHSFRPRLCCTKESIQSMFFPQRWVTVLVAATLRALITRNANEKAHPSHLTHFCLKNDIRREKWMKVSSFGFKVAKGHISMTELTTEGSAAKCNQLWRTRRSLTRTNPPGCGHLNCNLTIPLSVWLR